MKEDALTVNPYCIRFTNWFIATPYKQAKYKTSKSSQVTIFDEKCHRDKDTNNKHTHFHDKIFEIFIHQTHYVPCWHLHLIYIWKQQKTSYKVNKIQEPDI